MSITITRKDLRDTRTRIFFILGPSRSGSTLLQSMLSSHSKIVVPPETHFFYSYQTLKQRFEKARNKELFRDKLLDFWYDQKTRIRDLGLPKEWVLKAAKELTLNHPLELFTLQLTMYRKERDKKIIGEKTPRHILHIPDILETYPNARIISLFRDPRATASSEIKVRFGSPSVTVTTRRWRKYAQIHENTEKELPEWQYLMLRYRDLISDTKEVLQKICSFLEVTFEEQMLEFYNRNESGFAKGEKSWKKDTFKPIQKNKNEEWKSSLSDWQVNLVENTAGEYLGKMDYKKKNHSTFAPHKKWYFRFIDFCKSIWATLIGSRKEGYISPKKFKL